MSDGDCGAGAFGPAPGVGDARASLDGLAVGGGLVYVLSPREACSPLSSLLQSDSVELAPTNEGGHEMAVTVDPRNPGVPRRFVRDEDAHPEGPRRTGGAAP